MDNFDCVNEQHKNKALKELHNRMEKGETAESITGIKDKFYLEKLVRGFMPISYHIYDKIMGCSLEDALLIN